MTDVRKCLDFLLFRAGIVLPDGDRSARWTRRKVENVAKLRERMMYGKKLPGKMRENKEKKAMELREKILKTEYLLWEKRRLVVYLWLRLLLACPSLLDWIKQRWPVVKIGFWLVLRWIESALPDIGKWAYGLPYNQPIPMESWLVCTCLPHRRTMA